MKYFENEDRLFEEAIKNQYFDNEIKVNKQLRNISALSLIIFFIAAGASYIIDHGTVPNIVSFLLVVNMFLYLKSSSDLKAYLLAKSIYDPSQEIKTKSEPMAPADASRLCSAQLG